MNNTPMKEKVLIFLYILNNYEKYINRNTLERYIYLYYISLGFFDRINKNDNIFISYNKNSINIPDYDTALNELEKIDFILVRDNDVEVCQELIDYVKALLCNKEGQFYYNYMELIPFINLLKSYNDDFIFTIFFSEPTFLETEERRLSNISIQNSSLVNLLNTFKKKVNVDEIDEYDILSHWMDFILKEFYKKQEEE